jgi:hypothetical protein
MPEVEPAKYISHCKLCVLGSRKPVEYRGLLCDTIMKVVSYNERFFDSPTLKP